jgi:hypothetical protein
LVPFTRATAGVRSGVTARTAGAAAATVPPAASDRDARAAIGSGPGWFMSSWELERGLEVREGWPGDRGVNEWIDGFLKV